jgi:hypothetical protein
MSDVRRKTLMLDQSLIHKAQRIYGARTETETITRALEQESIRRNSRQNPSDGKGLLRSRYLVS